MSETGPAVAPIEQKDTSRWGNFNINKRKWAVVAGCIGGVAVALVATHKYSYEAGQRHTQEEIARVQPDGRAITNMLRSDARLMDVTPADLDPVHGHKFTFTASTVEPGGEPGWHVNCYGLYMPGNSSKGIEARIIADKSWCSFPLGNQADMQIVPTPAGN